MGALFHCETATKFNGPRAGHSEQTRATKTNTKTKQTKNPKRGKIKEGDQILSYLFSPKENLKH